jgi:hypothetical protein
MERTLLFNFPASLRDVRNWQHLGDVAILANVHRQQQPLNKNASIAGRAVIDRSVQIS